MQLEQLLKEGNVVAAMVVGTTRMRCFKLNGSMFEVEENLSNGTHTLKEVFETPC